MNGPGIRIYRRMLFKVLRPKSPGAEDEAGGRVEKEGLMTKARAIEELQTASNCKQAAHRAERA